MRAGLNIDQIIILEKFIKVYNKNKKIVKDFLEILPEIYDIVLDLPVNLQVK